MTVIANTKLGVHRDTPRIWLEGTKLAREGLYPGMKYNLEMGEGKVKLSPCDEGRYTVSQRKRNGDLLPLIDLTLKELAEVFDGVEMLRVLIRNKTIVITPHHQHQRQQEREQRLYEKLSAEENLAVCSLFHGGGVLDCALHQGLDDGHVGSRLAVAVEIDAGYLESSLSNNPQLWDGNSIVIEAPIQTVNLKLQAGFSVDILIGGVPCTGASVAGRAKKKLEFAESHSEAGAMFFSYLKFVEQLNPSVVILENVPAYANTASMEVIRSVLTGLGYTLQERVLDGNEFGVLESRQRFCMVAISSGLELAGIFNLDAVMSVRQKEARMADVFEDVPHSSERWRTYDYLKTKEVRDKAAGKGFSRQLLTGDEGSCNTINRTYNKGQSTGVYIIHPADPELSRLLTPVEHARVKGIPEGIIAGLPDTTAHEVLGQSVVYPAFQAVAQSLALSMWEMMGIKVSPKQVENTSVGDDCNAADPTTSQLIELTAVASQPNDFPVIGEETILRDRKSDGELVTPNLVGQSALSRNQLSLLGL